MKYYIGVDVGTGSVRAGLVDEHGCILATSSKEIQIWNPKPEYHEQSTDNIWNGVIETVKNVLEASDVRKKDVAGIGFCATCSLVVLDKDCHPVSVSPTGDSQCNIIMWMDHRAASQAERINSTKHDVLKYVGGKVFLEMEMPKIMWLKENMNSSQWENMGHFFELPDFLTWRATGSFSRSVCSLVSKFNYRAASQTDIGWSDEFLSQIGLEDLIKCQHSRIGSDVKKPGQPCGSGLSEEVAGQFGLCLGTPVATSVIDAHAGALGCFGCSPDESSSRIFTTLCSRVALICGTSSCHMFLRKEPIFLSGVWGPFLSVIIPGMWSHEGGQSATGKLIDFIVENHVSYPKVKILAEERGQHVHEVLNSILEEERKKASLKCISYLTKNLHVWPDFHGNRSLGDPTLKGMISGLTLCSEICDLAILYLATIQALAFGTRHIFEQYSIDGHVLEMVVMCGGLRKNPVFVKTHADVIGISILLPHEEESVLLGSAILGASSSGNFNNIQEAIIEMGGKGKLVLPETVEKGYYDKKYQIFLKMFNDQKQYEKIMRS